MRVLVCGGRDYNDKTKVWKALHAVADQHGMIFLIQGGAKGADSHARDWVRDQMRTAPRRASGGVTFHADWLRYGPKAGPIRNQKMIDEGKPDLVIAFPGGKGTADMVRRARAAGIEVREIAA